MRTLFALCLLILAGCASIEVAPQVHPVAVNHAPPSSAPARSAFSFQAAAIFIAVAIFLAREGLEASRRYKTRKRQIMVLKANLARQCEFNNWSYRALRNAVSYVRGSLQEDDGDAYKLVFQRNGSIRLTVTRLKRGSAGMMLPKVRIAELEARLMEAADLDPELLALTDEAATGSAEMLHIRDSLISYILKEEDDEMDLTEEIFLDFTRYALAELENTYSALNELYVYCTGNQLTSHRLR